MDPAHATCQCQRCGARCRVGRPRNPEAKLLRRSKQARGLCVNCALHDWLRNTYPVNALLEQMGPGGLACEQVREQIYGIMKAGLADACPAEINWNLISENWDLPWPHEVRRSATNPYVPGVDKPFGRYVKAPPDPLEGVDTITSFDQLNLLQPGLGDDLRRKLEAFDRDPPPPPQQRDLF